jgi:DNA primase
VRIVELEGGLDPDEYCKQHGAEAYQQRIANAKTYFYWLADRARARFNMREPQGRVDAFQFLLPAIQGLNDKLERVAVANDLASYLGVAPGLVLDHFRKAAADRVERSPVPKTEPSRATDRILLPLLVNDSEARAQLIDRLRDIPALKQSSAGPIYDAVLTMQDAGETVSFNTLHARLHPSTQDVLAAIVLDAGSGSAATLEDGLACVEALRREDRDAILRELKSRIKSAERDGRLAEAIALMQQLSQFA